MRHEILEEPQEALERQVAPEGEARREQLRACAFHAYQQKKTAYATAKVRYAAEEEEGGK